MRGRSSGSLTTPTTKKTMAGFLNLFGGDEGRQATLVALILDP